MRGKFYVLVEFLYGFWGVFIALHIIYGNVIRFFL